jgi:ABC-type antimicrobial peptide transport system ATPase subunit
METLLEVPELSKSFRVSKPLLEREPQSEIEDAEIPRVSQRVKVLRASSRYPRCCL